MDSLQNIKNRYQTENIEQAFRDIVADSPLTEEQRAKLLADKRELWNAFIETAETVEDVDDFRKVLANQYIELKSRWFLLNTQIQYQTFLDGMAEPVTTFKASLVSHLVGFFEGSLHENDLAAINRFLADPMREDLGDLLVRLDRVSEVVQSEASMEQQLVALYAEKEALRHAVGTDDAEAVAGMIQSLQGQVEDLYNDREKLQNALGTADADALSEMIQSMDAQLNDLYGDLENAVIVDGREIRILGPRKVIIRKQKNNTRQQE